MTRGSYKAAFGALLLLGAADWLALNLAVGPAWIAQSRAAAPPPSPSGGRTSAPSTAPAPPPASQAPSAPPLDSAAPAPPPSAAPSASAPAASSAPPPAPDSGALAVLHFAPGSTTLKAEAVEPIKSVAASMRADLTLRPRFVGHADDPGGKAANEFLALQRARVARSFLGSFGVDPGRVAVEGFGNEKKLDLAGTEQSAANNRRVEIFLK